MRRFSMATPCPGPQHHGMRALMHPDDTLYQDDTAHVEYTTELQQTLRGAKPRRPRPQARKSAFNPATDIHMDAPQDPWLEQAGGSSRPRLDKSARRSSILLSRPAQKISIAAPEPIPEAGAPLEPIRTGRRRISVVAEENNHDDTCRLEKTQSRRMSISKPRTHVELKKDPRRRTIYVPDDTTVMTIHPGQQMQKPRTQREKSPDIGFDLVTLSEEEDDLVPAIKQRPRSRKSIALPPRRGGLQTQRRPSQSVSFTSDVPGVMTGKENVPPGHRKDKNFEVKVMFEVGDAKKAEPVVEPPRRPRQSLAPQQSTTIEVTKKRARQAGSVTSESPAKLRKSHTGVVSGDDAQPASTTRAAQVLQPASPFRMNRSPPNALRRHAASIRSSTQKVSPTITRPLDLKFPVLKEDLARPELYEDNWLDYQEIALTQLINNIFRTAERVRHDDGVLDLRSALIGIYHNTSTPLLYKKLQASLSFGALQVPEDVLAKSVRIKEDIGVRQRFLNLWLDTYDLASLKAAVEVVVAREIVVPDRSSTGSQSSTESGQRKRLRRSLEDFIGAFLIRNEDAVKPKSATGTIGSIARGYEQQASDHGTLRWSWRRTVLRTLMIILLLDRAKNSHVITTCLFQKTSEYKSSPQILQAFAKLLLPTYGDITRPLGHVNYQVSHIQYPLQEYKYRVRNIAADLRDGVLLSRLVELLLYAPANLGSYAENTVTITLPAGEVLMSNTKDEQTSWIISQHLKLPCIGHAQKHYNVELTLSALRSLRGTAAQSLEGVSADDIVDGHRERTLGLLWAIVGKYGLVELADWTEVQKEIHRFRGLRQTLRVPGKTHDDLSDSDDDTVDLRDPSYCKRLLRKWATSIARLHNLRLTNLTTSFASGAIFEAIVDAYLPFCTPTSPSSAMTQPIFSNPPPLTMAEKLTKIGCSRAFISLFSTPSQHAPIPSKDFSLTTLAFLASRLIPLSISHRAASTIQRAWRVVLARREAHRRVMLMKLAKHCAMVVQTRERVVGAARMLQGAWRAALSARKERLRRTMVKFQSAARGMLVRERLGVGRGGGLGMMGIGSRGVGGAYGNKKVIKRAGW